MLDLEAEKSDLLSQIAVEEIAKPPIEKDRIAFWLLSFKNLDVSNENYRSRIINTLVNRVDVYDSDGGGKKITITYNISGENTSTVTSSDIACVGAPSRKPSAFGFLFLSDTLDNFSSRGYA